MDSGLLHTRKHRGSHKHGVRMDDEKMGILQLIEKRLFREEKRKAQKHARETDPQRQGSGREKFVPQTSAGGANISAPLSLRPAGAISVSDKRRKLRRTDRPQPNTHQQEQQLNKPQKSLSPNPKGIIQENNILYNSGNGQN